MLKCWILLDQHGGRYQPDASTSQFKVPHELSTGYILVPPCVKWQNLCGFNNFEIPIPELQWGECARQILTYAILLHCVIFFNSTWNCTAYMALISYSSYSILYMIENLPKLLSQTWAVELPGWRACLGLLSGPWAQELRGSPTQVSIHRWLYFAKIPTETVMTFRL